MLALLWTTWSGASAAETRLASWDFATGMHGWTTNSFVSSARISNDGLALQVGAPDPFLTAPTLNLPPGQHLRLTLRMRSTSDPVGQVYYGSSFSEGNSRHFSVVTDGQWHEYVIPIPPQDAGARLRLDPCHDAGDVGIAWIHLDASTEPFREPWASPRELRSKRIIGGGQYTTVGGNSAVTSRYLASHPGFLESYPYDGLVIPVVIGAEHAGSMGIPARDYFLHELLWNTVRIPIDAVTPAIAALNSVRWGDVTDNFLNMTLIDGTRGRFMPDFENDADWAILEHNAATAARLCREARLQGFWLDTEQYGNYRWRTASGVPEFDTNRPSNLKFPLGKDSPEVLRRRGSQWIKAVQSELPAVKIVVTFAWSPDADGYEPLKGTTGFLNGVLDSIRPPGQIVHGYENTFYYGQGPGTLNAANDGKAGGYPGDRGRYDSARTLQHSWRALSSNPSKYDDFVKVGMAAWVEDDPWNIWNGFPAGTKASFWSNLPLALAYSDEYVWVWSEHTHYAHGHEAGGRLNPFLASLRNQTFNTGREAVLRLSERFNTDPLNHGWYFDFDMLSIGRKRDGSEVATMSTDSIPYVWSAESRSLQVSSTWPASSDSRSAPSVPSQRKRFVHPVESLDLRRKFETSALLQFESFGNEPGAPVLFGFFGSAMGTAQQSLSIHIHSPSEASLVAIGNQNTRSQPFPLPAKLVVGRTYLIDIRFDPATHRIDASLTDQADPALLRAHASLATDSSLPRFDPDGLDELGVALSEGPDSNSPASTIRYRVKRIDLTR